MKKTLFIINCLFLSITAFSQTSNVIPELGDYFWNTPIIMELVKNDGETLGQFVESRSGQKFRIIKIINSSHAILTINNYSSPTAGSGLIYNTNGVLPSDASKAVAQSNDMIRTAADAAGTSAAALLPAGSSSSLIATTKKTSRDSYLSANPLGDPLQAFNDAKRFFKVSLGDVIKYASNNNKLSGSLAFGLINFPFKYRLRKEGEGDFAGAFNFGAALGYTVPRRQYRKASLSFLTGYSISNTVLDKSGVRRNSEDLVETNNYSAFSLSVGPMVESNRVQVGVFFGTDLLGRINQDRFGWKYQGRPWFSIGIGYSIFSKQEQKGTSNNDPNSGT